MKKRYFPVARARLSFLFCGFLLSFFLFSKASAFSLLGPYASWMDVTKGYQTTGDIGGPMNIGEGYRWNMPVVTYGFDRSFLDYFGSNGVAAVESAFQMLNQLPSASAINLTNYPTNAWRMNYRAQATSLIDLKSTVLCLLLEQMGLASPQSYVFCVRDYQLSGSNYIFFVTERNFDPVTAQPSLYINGTLFTYQIMQFAQAPTPTNLFCYAESEPVNPFDNGWTTIAGRRPSYGAVVTNLSQDDVGGLRYLLNGNLINYETLLPDVRAANTNTPLVRSAYRPGIEKITFLPHPASVLSGEFRPFTNQWTDVYYDTDDYPNYQEVERITTTPDILFTARDLGSSMLFQRTGTTNWANNADLNGNMGGAGPGIIQPPIVLALNDAIASYINQNPNPNDVYQTNAYSYDAWGSFDISTNAPTIYPAGQVLFQPTQVHFSLMIGGNTNQFVWSLPGVANGRFYFQTATNWNSWTTLTMLTNSGVAFDCVFQAVSNEQSRFFRLLPAQ